MKQKGFAPIVIVILLAVLSVGGFIFYQASPHGKIQCDHSEGQIFSVINNNCVLTGCTQEAKLCPDGSSVDRTGPNCEFSPCPSPSESTNSAQGTLSIENQLIFFARSRNAWRKQSIQTFSEYLTKYAADNGGALPSTITTTTQKIGKSGADLCSFIIPKYDDKLNRDTGTVNSELITDCTTSYDTGFTIFRDSNNRVTIAAPFAELSETISVSKQF